MPEELTLVTLDKLVEQTREEITGVVVSPEDARGLKAGSKFLFGVDDYRVFSLNIYVSDLVQDGKPIILTRKNILLPG